MEKKKLTIWKKILIGLVVAAIAWVTFQNRREAARVQQLGSLPPCSLAAEYMGWRLAFEDEHPEAEVTGSAAEHFIKESEVFERAVRVARSGSQSRLLEELEALTTVDSAGWVRGGGDIDSFVEIMLSECPDEVQELISRGQR
jgi:hypothetical protein